MNVFHKIFLIFFVVLVGVNLYAINWRLGFFHEENSSLMISLSASVIGVLAVYALHLLSLFRKK